MLGPNADACENMDMMEKVKLSKPEANAESGNPSDALLGSGKEYKALVPTGADDLILAMSMPDDQMALSSLMRAEVTVENVAYMKYTVVYDDGVYNSKVQTHIFSFRITQLVYQVAGGWIYMHVFHF